MSELSQDEKDRVLRLDCSLGLATMAVIGRALDGAKGQRDFELIIRAVAGFAATSVIAIKKVSEPKVLTHEQAVAALAAWWEEAGKALLMEAFADELRRIAVAGPPLTNDDVAALFAVRH